MPQGEKNKLSNVQKEQIRALKGQSSYKVGEQFGVSHTMILKIWKSNSNHQQSNSNQDTQLIKKMIPAFIKKGIKIPMSDEEWSRIEQLAKEVLE